uniref:Ig-like domain-containing protein n=1 Tax=Xenopus tropicalis TaxID=8364 RepID=F6YN86_XENTR
GGFPGSYSQDWAITLPKSIRALRGSCVVIPCTFTLPRGNKDFSLDWYKEKFLFDKIIFSQWDPSDVSEGYRGRTSLVGNEPNSCSLRINDVQENGTYYPYIHGNCDVSLTANYQCHKVQVTVSDVPNEPAIQIPTDLTEGERTPISCSVEHTCPPSPPTLQWNRAGYKLTDRQQSLKDGVWKAETVMEYLPSYRDHGAELECEATYPNGLRSQRRVTLNITYSPKNVSVVISDGKKERKEGDAVSLTCASDANPAANAFTWYNNKRDGTVELREEQGRSITVTVGRGRETFSCTARNPLGTGNSTLSELQVLSAQTGEELPTSIILGGGAGPVLVILLPLGLCLCLRNRKSQKGGESGGRGAGANVQNSQPTESPYTALQTRDTAVYYIIKPQIHQQNRSK